MFIAWMWPEMWVLLARVPASVPALGKGPVHPADTARVIVKAVFAFLLESNSSIIFEDEKFRRGRARTWALDKATTA